MLNSGFRTVQLPSSKLSHGHMHGQNASAKPGSVGHHSLGLVSGVTGVMNTKNSAPALGREVQRLCLNITALARGARANCPMPRQLIKLEGYLEGSAENHSSEARSPRKRTTDTTLARLCPSMRRNRPHELSAPVAGAGLLQHHCYYLTLKNGNCPTNNALRSLSHPRRSAPAFRTRRQCEPG
jgi:hypothetical protein